VREAKGEQAAQLIDHLKKGEMAERAQELLASSGWLPEPLRTPRRSITTASAAPEVEAGSPVSGEESAATGYETAMAESKSPTEDEPVATEPHAVAAE
jgi:ParB family transcriptional regulator, chromosome partitioning protein